MIKAITKSALLIALFAVNSNAFLGLGRGVLIADKGSASITIKATGGTVTDDGLYRVHTFTSNGTFTVIPTSLSVDMLLVAGGGGGGEGHGGGGGGGGLIYRTSTPISANAYSVVIGTGGAAKTTGSNANGNPGGNTTFSTFTAIGGGLGAGYGGTGGNGGSGGGSGGEGGGGGTATSGQGYGGGSMNGTANGTGGGGGGCGSAGSSGDGTYNTTDRGGSGGLPCTYSISGTLKSYSAGGGAGAYTTIGLSQDDCAGDGGDGKNHVPASAGQANTGCAGGGGSAGGTGSDRYGAAGGSGIVIFRYLR